MTEAEFNTELGSAGTKKSMYWALVYLLANILIFSMNPPLDKFLYIMAAYGAAYILIMGALMAEFENQTNMLLNSLLVNRYKIILSKYLSALVLASFKKIRIG